MSESGIYKHFKGNLYFVLGLAWSREDPTNIEKAEVIYHPLYQCENLRWMRDISLKTFLENIDRPEFYHSGPRFSKIIDWELPNILPGCAFRDNLKGKGKIFVIRKCYLTLGRKICVESSEIDSPTIYGFPLSYIQNHCILLS